MSASQRSDVYARVTQAIVDAIEAGDPDAAAAQMESHLREILTSLPMLAERYPEHFIDD